MYVTDYWFGQPQNDVVCVFETDRNPKSISIRSTTAAPSTYLLMSGLASVHSAWLRFHKSTPRPLYPLPGKVTPKKAATPDLLDGRGQVSAN